MPGVTMRVRRPLAVAISAMGLAVLVASAPATAAASASGVPFTDPSAVGVIGLCDRAGHQITHGSINARPFVWRAVSTVAAQGGYADPGRTATLFAYQPRQGVAPGDWSGAQLTASARYTDPAHPMAAATAEDESLAQFMGEFAPSWDGVLQLRIFLSAPDEQVDSLSYPATTIRVTGQTWQVVNPTPVPCNTGTSTSIESILLPSTKGGSAKPAGSGGGAGTSTETTPATGAATAPSAPAATSPATAPTPVVTSSASNVALASDAGGGSNHHGLELGVAAAVVVGALLAGGLFLGRRSTTRSAG